MIGRGTIVLLIIAFVAASIIGILYATNRIDTAQTLEIAALTTLVLITAWYAKQPTIMAKEMRKQRYDTARPVIDIQREDTGDAHISAGLAAQSGDFAWGLSCKLHNIGLGPAVDIHSYVQFQRKRWPFDFGTIAAKERTKGKALSVSEEGGRLVLKVYYKDIYGRDFESSREVQIDKATSNLELGPLKSILVKENKPK